MNLLAIETTGAKASAALIHEGGRLEVQGSEQTMNHLQHLMPMIDQLLSKCGKTIDDVSVIAVSEGPGSFTGIRIGMAAAKALGQVLGVPMVTVPTLESFTYHIPQCWGLLCPIFDAKRSQVYGGIFAAEAGGNYRRLAEDGAYDLKVYLDKLKEAVIQAEVPQITLFGDGIQPYGEIIENAVEDWKTAGHSLSLKGDLCLKLAPEQQRFQDAGSVARLGLELYRQGKGKSFREVHPVYLRKAEAERKLEEAAGK